MCYSIQSCIFAHNITEFKYGLKPDLCLKPYFILCHADVDNDWIFEPVGPRERKRNEGEHIQPFLTDEELYKRFYVHATKKLKLMPKT